ncbi:MAG: hypothetical protein JRG97_17195 [Deltaproteobacteria bacterium]|nr:hypothetical protein [Deltaproteobacteria bacterium]
MSEKTWYDNVSIGMEVGPFEMILDEDSVRARIQEVQWEPGDLIDSLNLVPPGMTIVEHARMKFRALPKMRSSIWAKSEHEFIKPMKIGEKVIIRGKVVEKYVKKGRDYLVTEYETVNEAGELLMRSRETGTLVEWRFHFT